MDWKPEAIEAALSTYWKKPWDGACKDPHAALRVKAMRDALDAAVEAQGGVFMTTEQFAEKMADAHGAGQLSGYEDGRAEAFEEASAFIKALAKQPPKG